MPIDILAVVCASVALPQKWIFAAFCVLRRDHASAAALLHKERLRRPTTRVLSRLSSLLCAGWLIIATIAANLVSVLLWLLVEQQHYLDCLTLRGSQEELRVSCVTDLLTEKGRFETPNFKLWFSVKLCALRCKICNDVQTAPVRLLYTSSCYHYLYVPSCRGQR